MCLGLILVLFFRFWLKSFVGFAVQYPFLLAASLFPFCAATDWCLFLVLSRILSSVVAEQLGWGRRCVGSSFSRLAVLGVDAGVCVWCVKCICQLLSSFDCFFLFWGGF